MEKINKKEIEELQNNPNVLYHFTIYLEQLANEKWRIASSTLATDKGKLNEEEIRDKLVKRYPGIKKVQIGVLIVTRKIKEAEMHFKSFRAALGRKENDFEKEDNLKEIISTMKYNVFNKNHQLN